MVALQEQRMIRAQLVASIIVAATACVPAAGESDIGSSPESPVEDAPPTDCITDCHPIADSGPTSDASAPNDALDADGGTGRRQDDLDKSPERDVETRTGPGDVVPEDAADSRAVDITPDTWACVRTVDLPVVPCDRESQPECNYEDFNGFIPEPYTVAFQFEHLSSSSSPGMPDGLVCDEGKPLIVLRMKWYDCWALDGCKLSPPCGGHCYPFAGYVYIINPEVHEIVGLSKESLAAWQAWTPQPQLAVWEGVQDGTFAVDVPESGLQYRFTHGGLGPPHGTSDVLPDMVRVYDGDETNPVATIDLPLF
jgi:hypothetical protein